jgi:hypothetical protein
MQADADVLQERDRGLQEWQAWKASKQETMALVEGFRKQMFGAKWAEKEFTMERVTVEQTVEVKEEPFNRYSLTGLRCWGWMLSVSGVG